MNQVLFSTEIEEQTIALKTAADVVRFGFVMQPSVSFLDLQLCKNAPFSDYFGSLRECCARKRLRSYVNTKEKFRKFFTPSGELLYTLHLDLAKGWEDNCIYTSLFKRGIRPDSQHVSKIRIVFGLYGTILSNFIRSAIDMNVPKMKMLKRIMEISSLEYPLLYRLSIPIVSEFLECFYPTLPTCELFKNFVRNFDLIEWSQESRCPKKMEYLLYCVRRHGNVLFRDDDFESLTRCLWIGHFGKIGPVLKYGPAATLVKDDYEENLSALEQRGCLTKSLVEDVQKWMGEDRVHRMLQIIYVYMDRFRHDPVTKPIEALGLVWKSIPDPYVTSGELQMLGLVEDVSNVHDFYEQAVGESCENLEPRSLKHLCRTVVRSTLWVNKLWIPEGIRKLPLPESLQLYLNLDQPFSMPYSVVFKRSFNELQYAGPHHKASAKKVKKS